MRIAVPLQEALLSVTVPASRSRRTQASALSFGDTHQDMAPLSDRPRHTRRLDGPAPLPKQHLGLLVASVISCATFVDFAMQGPTPKPAEGLGEHDTN